MAYKKTSNNDKIYSLWQSLQIRFTSFSVQIDESETSKWWESVVGEPSEQKTSLQKLKLYQELGSYCNGKLVLSSQLNTVNWIYVPKENELSTGPFIDSLNDFSKLMPKWFDISPPVNRLALGLILHVPVKSKEEGYEFISKLLIDVNVDINNFSDFMYQVNKPRKTTTGIANLNINRLMKWSVALVKNAVFSAGGVEYVAPSDYSARLELDINTAAEYKDNFPNDKIHLIYSEFESLAKEILVSGDKP